ncbi:MAG: hypothetical protein WCB96_12765 [Candidatus Aminicenantales bacterium]
MTHKRVLLMAVFILGTGLLSLRADVLRFELQGSYFRPSEQAFRDIYGAGQSFGLEAGLRITKWLEAWMGGGYFAKNGHLSFTGEETRVKITRAGAGLMAVLPLGKHIQIDLGAGLLVHAFEERNIIGAAHKTSLGYVAKEKLIVKLFSGFFLDLRADYSSCRLKPAEFLIDVGGLEAGLGLGFIF